MSLSVDASEQPHERQLHELEALLRELAPLAIGFSGGVDSTFLALVAQRAIPSDAVLVHANTPFAATPERNACADFARTCQLPFITIDINPFEHDEIARNAPDRCYACKRLIFSNIIEAARRAGAQTVVDGSNADDAGDDRPGMRALQELGVRSPLLETGWHKADERALLQRWNVPIWNMPAGACLATRVACGVHLTPAAVQTISACEDLLHDSGYAHVRARLRNGEISIEAGQAELERIAASNNAITTSHTLPTTILSELTRIASNAGYTVSPAAHPYQHGHMNGGGR